MKLFSDMSPRTHADIAKQMYPVLLTLVMTRQTITYKQLCEMIGWGRADYLSHPLSRIYRWCEKNGLPPLTTLVVSQSTGSCGDGINMTLEDVLVGRERVYAMGREWFAIVPPSTKTLERLMNE